MSENSENVLLVEDSPALATAYMGYLAKQAYIKSMCETAIVGICISLIKTNCVSPRPVAVTQLCESK